MEQDTFTDGYVEELKEGIGEHGWMVQLVGPDEDTGDPEFAYTVGLTRFHDHPELIAVCLSGASAGHVLNQLGSLVRDGGRLAHGDVVPVPGGAPVVLLEVLDPSDRLYLADHVYLDPDGPPLRALQVVWADPRGHYPWQPGYDARPCTQLLLGPPPRVAVG